MNTYRVVHFLPDPFSGARLPIAALLAGSGAGVKAVRRRNLRVPSGLGGKAADQLVKFILEALDRAERLDVLPFEIGPQSELGPERAIPATVTDPATWVREHVLEAASANASKRKPRAAESRFYLDSWGIGSLVKRRFRPDALESFLPRTSWRVLPPISQYVGSADRQLLLLEPLVSHESVVPEDDVREVYARVAAYQACFSTVDASKGAVGRLGVYVVGDDDDEVRRDMTSAFRGLDATLWFTSDDGQCRDFMTTVESTASQTTMFS